MEKDLSGRIQSVDRAMMLLETLALARSGYRLSELARRTKLSLTTVHRLLTTLQQRRFVHFCKDDNSWHIGLGAHAIGSAFMRDRHIVAAATPFLRRLRDETRETANVGIVEDCKIILADQMASRDSGRATAVVGAQTPMTASGMGKAFLSSYAKEEVASIVKRFGMQRITPKTLTSFEALARQLGKVEVDGFTIDDEESRLGMRCVAAPVYDSRREVVCAISISGSPSRITHERVPGLATIVKGVAFDFSRVVCGSF
jgi:IclR family transcriptional regulator, acetate operon repressor